MLQKSRHSFRHPRHARLQILSYLGAAGLLALATIGRAETKLDKEAAAKGRITYLRYCVSCHGKEARGDGPLAKDLREPVRDLTTLTARNGGTYPYDRVVSSISKGSAVKGHGTDDMPAWGPAFNRTNGIAAAAVDEAIRNVAQFLWSLQRN
jgi:mono/diheme cytochrome c family protein